MMGQRDGMVACMASNLIGILLMCNELVQLLSIPSLSIPCQLSFQLLSFPGQHGFEHILPLIQLGIL
jgi:hypothetical protein